MASYSRNISLRASFIQVLSRRSLLIRTPNRLRGNYLFRAMTRLVREYMDWLTETPVAEEISDDVAVNIRMAQEKKVEKKALALQDRSILLIRPEERSLDDKNYIYELFKKFHVFRKYPENLRESIAGVCFYQYIGQPDRVIVRQGRPAENVYFILSGEVGISKVVTDRWTGESETVDVGILSVGDIFGEIAMLHQIPRSATVITKSKILSMSTACYQAQRSLQRDNFFLAKVDLILIPCNSFDNVLRPHLQKEWDILQDAVVHFNYFKSWDKDTIRECCILSKLQNFQTDEVLLGDAKGMVNYVHFLVDGECRLIEHMTVRKGYSGHGAYYELYDPSKTDTKQQARRSSKSQHMIQGMDELQFEFQATRENGKGETREHESVDFARLLVSSKPADRKMDVERASIITTTLLDAMTQWHKITDVAEMLMREPSSISQQCYPSDVRTIFMQICTFQRGACFGLGENMRDRRIIAATPVRCFLVPRHWLSTHNRANIWERVKLFMDSKFPSKEQLFKEFERNRRWIEYKKTLFEDVGKRGRRIRSNVTIHDIPYAIRIVNDIGIEK